MTHSAGDDQTETKDRAREALMAVAGDDDVQVQYPMMTELCDEATLQSLVDLAWRHQFAEDRYAFKREVRDVQQYIASRARAGEESE